MAYQEGSPGRLEPGDPRLGGLTRLARARRALSELITLDLSPPAPAPQKAVRLPGVKLDYAWPELGVGVFLTVFEEPRLDELDARAAAERAGWRVELLWCGGLDRARQPETALRLRRLLGLIGPPPG
jgi:hypothetical protein